MWLAKVKLNSLHTNTEFSSFTIHTEHTYFFRPKKENDKIKHVLLSSVFTNRKYWICDNIRLPVFDGYILFRRS